MVGRDAARVRITAIAQRGGHRAAIQHHRADRIVERGGGDAGHYQRREFVEDARGELPRAAHALVALGPVELDGAIAMNGLAAVDGLVFGHTP